MNEEEISAEINSRLNKSNRDRSKFSTAVPNAIIDDPRLSCKAKAVACYFLSRPESWTFRWDEVVSHFSDGITALRAGMRELIANGYATMERTRENGKMGSVIYTIHHKATQGDAICGNSICGRAPHLSIEDNKYNDIKYNDNNNNKEKHTQKESREQEFAVCASLSSSYSVPQKATPVATEQDQESEQNFFTWWEVYPHHRRVDKKSCQRKFIHLSKFEQKRAIQHTEAMKRQEQWQLNFGRFIPLSTTYLNQQRYEMEIPPEKSAMTPREEFLKSLKLNYLNPKNPNQ